jgi:hypothetical protein
MKPRHAAALALAGWYLTMSPARLHAMSNYWSWYVIVPPNYPVDTAAPLSRWIVNGWQGLYGNTAEQCKQLLAAGKIGSQRARGRGDEMTAQESKNARCVKLNYDDPRLGPPAKAL